MSGPSSLVLYDAMVNAIAECERVDEAKDLRDKASALEAYYRQARNFEAERSAANVRLRAERRTGELLKELARADAPNPEGAGGHSRKVVTSHDGTQQASPYAEALAETGMTRQSAHRFQALANVPRETFESALAAPEKPSRSAILRVGKDPEPRVPDDALWLWGRLRDFERDGYFDTDPARLLSGMTDAMRADVLRLAPAVADFLASLERAHEPA